MVKIQTLFKKDPNNLSIVTDEINTECLWVYESGIPTRKFDGTACTIINGKFYKRYDAKINKKTGERKPVPDGAIKCQEPDKITGHFPHWIPCKRNDPSCKYHFQAYDRYHTQAFNPKPLKDGTYELCGEKINGNPERIRGHKLIRHGAEVLPLTDFSFNSIKEYLSVIDIEGIVFHDKNGSGKMCKIRKADFGLKRQKI